MTKRTSTADTSTIGGTFPGDIESEEGGGGGGFEKTNNILNNILADGQIVQFDEESKYHVPLVIPSTEDEWAASCIMPEDTSTDAAEDGDIILVGGEDHDAAVYSPSDNEMRHIDFENASSMSEGDSIAYSDQSGGFIVLSEDSDVRGFYTVDSSDSIIKDSDVSEPPSSDEFPRVFGYGNEPLAFAFEEDEPSFLLLMYSLDADDWSEVDITDEIEEIRDDQDSESDPADWSVIHEAFGEKMTVVGVGGDEEKVVGFMFDSEGEIDDYEVYDFHEEGLEDIELGRCSIGLSGDYIYFADYAGVNDKDVVVRYNTEEKSHSVITEENDGFKFEFSPLSVRSGLLYEIIRGDDEHGVRIISSSEEIMT